GLEDHEREVRHDVGAGDERLDRRAVEHVAAAVLGALPAVLLRVERAARHADDAPDVARALEGAHERSADLSRRAGDRDGEAGHQPLRRDSVCGWSTQAPCSSTRSPRTWTLRALRQAGPGSIGAPTGSEAMRTTHASRSARTGTRTANGKPS